MSDNEKTIKRAVVKSRSAARSTKKGDDKLDLVIEWIKHQLEVDSHRGANGDPNKKAAARKKLREVANKIKNL